MTKSIYQLFCKRKDDWFRAVKENHNNFYDYSFVDYVNAKTKVTIVCPKHGKFIQTPHDHKNKKHGCAKCFGNAKLTNEEVDRRIIDTHRTIKRVGDIKNAMTNSEWLCLNGGCGGTWQATPDNVLNKKTGCPYCEIGYLSNHHGVLYLVKIVDKDTNLEFLKIGITKKGVHRRYSGKRFKISEEIFIEEMPLKEAYRIEQKIINDMQEYSVLPSKSFGGRTECFVASSIVEENIISLLK